MACDFCLPALQGLSDVFDCTPYLWKLDLTGNPLTHHAKYRDRVITMVKGIGEQVGGGVVHNRGREVDRMMGSM